MNTAEDSRGIAGMALNDASLGRKEIAIPVQEAIRCAAEQGMFYTFVNVSPVERLALIRIGYDVSFDYPFRVSWETRI